MAQAARDPNGVLYEKLLRMRYIVGQLTKLESGVESAVLHQHQISERTGCRQDAGMEDRRVPLQHKAHSLLSNRGAGLLEDRQRGSDCSKM